MPRVGRLAGVICIAAGGGLCLLAAMLHARQIRWQEAHAGLFAVSRPANNEGAGPVARRWPAGRKPGRGNPVARLRIQRLGMDLVVAEGSDARTLLRGPGHMAGSALPGEADNCIIAGHRDGPFARLQSARKGDLVEIRSGSGTSVYRVASVSVVPKADAAPLHATDRPVLTLVTCYPIHFVGKAPERLVVRGVLVGTTS